MPGDRIDRDEMERLAEKHADFLNSFPREEPSIFPAMPSNPAEREGLRGIREALVRSIEASKRGGWASVSLVMTPAEAGRLLDALAAPAPREGRDLDADRALRYAEAAGASTIDREWGESVLRGCEKLRALITVPDALREQIADIVHEFARGACSRVVPYLWAEDVADRILAVLAAPAPREGREALKAMLVDLCQTSEQIGRASTIKRAGGRIDEDDYLQTLNLRHDRFDRILDAAAPREQEPPAPGEAS